jgi:hypothetical protein
MILNKTTATKMWAFSNVLPFRSLQLDGTEPSHFLFGCLVKIRFRLQLSSEGCNVAQIECSSDGSALGIPAGVQISARHPMEDSVY